MSAEDDLQIIQSTDGIAADVRSMILQTREDVAHIVNSGITLLYWRIGKRIQTEVLGHERAEYGKEILQTLSAKLISEFGQGFSQRNLRYMVTFAEIFPEVDFVAALSRQLGWSHFQALLPLGQPLQRDFYAEKCPIERWSVRTLRKKIGSRLYERTAIFRKPRKSSAPSSPRCAATTRFRPPSSFAIPTTSTSSASSALPGKGPRRRHPARVGGLPARTR